MEKDDEEGDQEQEESANETRDGDPGLALQAPKVLLQRQCGPCSFKPVD